VLASSASLGLLVATSCGGNGNGGGNAGGPSPGVGGGPIVQSVVGQGGAIATSPDGAAWTAADSGVTSDLASVAFSGKGLVAVGAGGSAILSADGAHWMAGRTGTTSNLRGVTWANDRFVAVGDSGVIVASTDGGASWSSIALSVTFSGSFGGVAAHAGASNG
jgi:hypothetical protein